VRGIIVGVGFIIIINQITKTMGLNNTTKYRVGNKFINGKVDQNQFDFENKGNYGKGRLTWSTAIKKNGQTTFESSSIGFVCFGENISIIENNLGSKFNIEGTIAQKRNPNATGDQPKTYWQIVVFGVNILEDDQFEKAAKAVDKHNKAKANAFVAEEEFVDDDFPAF